MTPVRYMDIREFREGGFLQEANRLFFHPLGLALETVSDTCPVCKGHVPKAMTTSACAECGGSGKVERLGGVWDYRDDPEGMEFGEGYGLDPAQAAKVDAERSRHVEARIEAFGLSTKLTALYWAVQPLEPTTKERS